MNSSPFLSVIMITYNHESYIAQAIEGVMMQQTSFPFELIIGEDYSTDNTRKICKEYKEKYPDIIKLLLPELNLGMMPNFIATIGESSGKYIALCEGDDYWTDPYKLQKQVDFLEANEDFSICFHNVKIWKDQEKIMVDDFMTKAVPEETDIYELAKENYIHTPSVVFRRKEQVLVDFIGLGKLSAGDYPLHLLTAKYGKIKKFSECMAVYRFGSGIWSNNQNIEFKFDSWLNLLDKLILYFENDKIIVSNLKDQYSRRAYVLYDFFCLIDEVKAELYFEKSMVNNPIYTSKKLKADYEKKCNELLALRSSKSYRIGKFIINPFLMMKNYVK